MDKHVFKVGDRVRIINQNEGPLAKNYNGGFVRDPAVVGQIVTLLAYVNDYGYWQVTGLTTTYTHYVFDERAFVLADAPVVKKEAAPVNVTVDALRKKASALHIVGYSKLKKPALIAAIAKKEEEAIVKPPVPVEKPKEPSLNDLIIKHWKEKVYRGICFFGLRTNGGKSTYIESSGACHASFNVGYGDGRAPITEACDNISLHGETGQKDVQPANWPAYKKAVQWLLSESPISPQFITKNVDIALENGIYYDVNRPTSHVVASAIFVRELSEFPARSKALELLDKKGIPFKFAWVLSRFLSARPGGQLTWTPQRASHCVMNVFNCSPEGFAAFMKNGFPATKEGPFATKGGYSIEASTYTKVTADKSIGHALSQLLNVKKPDGWAAVENEHLNDLKIGQMLGYFQLLLK